MDNLRRCKVNIGFLCLFLCLAILTGCGGQIADTRVVLTTGLKKDEVFRIESVSCSKPEMMVYITNMQNQYENVYGEEIWKTEGYGVTLKERVMDNALAKMAQVKTMNLMARSRGITLSSQESASVENAADIYYGSLSQTEIESMGINRNTIAGLYGEYLTARKVYQDIIKDINPEISDDEARNITIDYILIKTYKETSDGTRVEYEENERLKAYAKAQEAYKEAVAGESFDLLIAKYTEADESSASVSKEDIESDYIRTSLFELSKDEISPILSTKDGYLIAKCDSTYDLEETDQNKITIVDERREMAFSEEYDKYVENLTRKLNDALWEEIDFLHDDEITTSSFFKVADESLVLDEQL